MKLIGKASLMHFKFWYVVVSNELGLGIFWQVGRKKVKQELYASWLKTVGNYIQVENSGIRSIIID